MIATYKTILDGKTQLNSDTYLFNFKLVVPEEFSFVAGQYMILMVPQPDGQPVRRLYSLPSSVSQKKSFELLVELVPGGIGSEYLKRLKCGDEAIFQGPAGMFTLRDTGRDRIFLATGTGLAPILSMIDNSLRIKHDMQNSYLFWGERYLKEIYFFEKLKTIAENEKKFQFKICLSRELHLNGVGESGKNYFELGHIDIGMDKMLVAAGRGILEFDYYLCGSRSMVESVRQGLYQKSVPQSQVFFEKF